MSYHKTEKEKIHRTSIGGQAVMEGVMMRGPKVVATAVRKPDGEIVVDEQKLGKVRTGKFVKLPVIRGCVNFFDSMIIGVKSLMYSAQFLMWTRAVSRLCRSRPVLRPGWRKSWIPKRQ